MADFKLTKLIEKKRNGKFFTEDETNYFVDAVVKTTLPAENFPVGERPDRAQIGAMLMAMYLKGLNPEETSMLTLSMKNSGYIFSWPPEWSHLVVDKHSTGGVGDKVSLVLAPALAAVGLKIPMISGRSLGHTGGTLDKLESIPGFRVYLSKAEIYDIIGSIGCCIVGQTDDCVPADKVLYQCREITSTVNYPPLIIASIVSKKLSEGTKTLVYDVKYGKGSVFKSKDEALDTAKNLVLTSTGVKAIAYLTSMENPLGQRIGNSLEILEAIDCLHGRGPSDVVELTCALGSELLRRNLGMAADEGRRTILGALENGEALKVFHSMLLKQGVASDVAKEVCFGNADAVLPRASHETELHYEGHEGYVQEIDPLVLATVWKEELFRSNQHPGVGFTLLKTVGNKIEHGQPWIKFHHERKDITPEVHEQLRNALLVGSEKKERNLIDRKVTKSFV